MPVGTTVVWTHKSQRKPTVTADDGAFDSGTLEAGGSFKQTFDKAGTFPYFCQFHGGKAIVKEVISLPSDTFKLSGTGAKTSVLYLQKRHARDDAPKRFADDPQTDVFMAVADTLGYVVKNNVEDYGPGVSNDLAKITVVVARYKTNKTSTRRNTTTPKEYNTTIN